MAWYWWVLISLGILFILFLVVLAIPSKEEKALREMGFLEETDKEINKILDSYDIGGGKR